MKNLATTLSILLLVLLSSGCEILDIYPDTPDILAGPSNNVEKWLFTHTAPEVLLTNNATIVMSLASGDIFVSSDNTDKNRDNITGKDFTLIFTETNYGGFEDAPYSAKLTWVEDGTFKEAKVLITDASYHENSIIYSTQGIDMLSSHMSINMVSLYIFVDRARDDAPENLIPQESKAKGCPTNCTKDLN